MPTPTLTLAQIDAGAQLARKLAASRQRLTGAALDVARDMKRVLDQPDAATALLTPDQRLDAWRVRNGADALVRFAELKAIYDFLLAFAPGEVAPLLPACEACVLMIGDVVSFRYMPIARAEGRVIPVFTTEAQYAAFVANPPAPPSA